MTDEHKKYLETIETLYLVQDQLVGYEKNEERLDFLFKAKDVINRAMSDYLAFKVIGREQQEEIHKNVIQSLVGLFNRYGEFYFGEVIARRELFLKEKDLLAAYAAINELKDENEKLKGTLSFS